MLTDLSVAGQLVSQTLICLVCWSANTYNGPAVNGRNLDLLIGLLAKAVYHHVDRFVYHWTIGIPNSGQSVTEFRQ